MDVPNRWTRPAHGSWHLHRPDGRTFCGRKFAAIDEMTRPAPRPHESGWYFGTDGHWIDFGCWSCMDAFAPWAVRNGLTSPADPKWIAEPT